MKTPKITCAIDASPNFKAIHSAVLIVRLQIAVLLAALGGDCNTGFGVMAARGNRQRISQQAQKANPPLAAGVTRTILSTNGWLVLSLQKLRPAPQLLEMQYISFYSRHEPCGFLFPS
ncbi:MAG: hypothetical protein WBX25_12995 [Rhodomicrobium sp.]